MEELNTTQTASVFASKVNTNFGGTVISTDDTASAAVSDLNTAFDGAVGTSELSESSSANDFVNALNTNFAVYNNERTSLKFLHLSDPHGYYDAAQLCKENILADSDYEFLFITGDMTRYAYNTISDELLSQMDTLKGQNKLLLLAGNHDTYDNKFGTNAASQQATTQFLLSYLGNNVTWGDARSGAEKVASYWHKDFIIGSHKLRIISVDQYETSLRNYTYFTMYTQAQISWFIARLKELNAGDYLIIATHEPPVQSRTVPQGGGSGDTAEDSYAVGLRPSSNADTAKLFVTEGLRAFGNRRSEPNWNLLPRIMDAYLNKRTLTMTYNNYGGGSPSDITINEDFSQDNPATFLFYLGGHRHADICTYLPNETGATDGGDWSEQLMLYITAADRRISWQYDDDLGGSSNWLGTPSVQSTDQYRYNEVELDFDAKTITVTRYGDQKTYGGRVRNEVVFPFVKGGGV